MKERILQILTEKHKVCGIHNGVRTSDLCEQLGVPFREVKDDLNQLYLDGKIEIKNSINFKFISLKDGANSKTNSEV